MSSYRRLNRFALVTALLVLAQSAAAAKAVPPPPTGELSLDLADPVISVKIGQVPLRLRVALEQKRLIELNPDAAERLRADPPSNKFRFEPGFDALVGRETLRGIEAAAPITLNGRKMVVLVASHGRDCCPGVDGEIGIGLLPYATIRLVRPGAPDPGHSADFLIDDDSERGPQTMLRVGGDSLFVQFSFVRPDSVATAAGGAILARSYGGRLTQASGPAVAAFGIARPTAMLSFPRVITLAGFRFDRLAVRTADFAGHFEFPVDHVRAGDIIVKKKVDQQAAWPMVLIGRDRLDRCSEALFDTVARKLTLRCAFDVAT